MPYKELKAESLFAVFVFTKNHKNDIYHKQ